jgi:hypothetical protein
MKNTLVKTLGWLPCILLLAGAINHLYLVKTSNLSPWLGGGFGMFASTDVAPSRLLVVTAVHEDGDEYTVPSRGRFKKLKRRALGLPGRRQLELLARAIWERLEREPVDETGSPLQSLRIEVWKTRYEANSLQPQQTQIALEHFDFNP